MNHINLRHTLKAATLLLTLSASAATAQTYGFSKWVGSPDPARTP